MESTEARILGAPLLAGRSDRLEVRFVGRTGAALAEVLAALPDGPAESSWLRQVHSAHVLEARAGCAGEGDALITSRTDLGLAIATADCVPVVLGGDGAVTAIHAGWRGIASRILPRAVEAMTALGGVETAWIGPAIGPCCYEVGEDVAQRVVEASHLLARGRPTGAGRPTLDLPAAAVAQLLEAGVADVRRTAICTRCDAAWSSYRRDGGATDRNWTLAWLRPSGT